MCSEERRKDQVMQRLPLEQEQYLKDLRHRGNGFLAEDCPHSALVDKGYVREAKRPTPRDTPRGNSPGTDCGYELTEKGLEYLSFFDLA